MQLRHVRSITQAADGPNKVVAIAWSPNSTRLAIATADRVVSLFDEGGELRKDKFPTKPVRACCPPARRGAAAAALCFAHTRLISFFSPHTGRAQADPARKEYFVTGLAWSPDSTKLAVAQSDNIVFLYKVRATAGLCQPRRLPHPALTLHPAPLPPPPPPFSTAGPGLGGQEDHL